jgi:hypothetical protein
MWKADVKLPLRNCGKTSCKLENRFSPCLAGTNPGISFSAVAQNGESAGVQGAAYGHNGSNWLGRDRWLTDDSTLAPRNSSGVDSSSEKFSMTRNSNRQTLSDFRSQGGKHGFNPDERGHAHGISFSNQAIQSVGNHARKAYVGRGFTQVF